jgi:uncharacterized protein YfkK (UPF0435 family)
VKKLAIVGAEEHTRHLAPYDDPEYDIWVFNEWANADWCKRWDALIQIHQQKVYRNLKNEKDPKHWEWLQKKHGKPVYMLDVDPLVPDSVKYPLDEIMQKYHTGYLRATICYAIALALYQGYEEIHIWGVELKSHAEYRSQRDCFIFWNGVAHGKIKLHCCKGMFDQPLYGKEEYMQEDEIQRYIEGLTVQVEEAKKKLHMLEGALALAKQMHAGKEEDVQEVPQPVQEKPRRKSRA